MSKMRKSILIIGILVVIVAASLATALALFATDSIVTDPIAIVFSVKDEVKEYDGTPLKATECKITEGELAKGHVAEVQFVGEQTSVGVSQSGLSVKICDEEGYNVTDKYAVKVVAGFLAVTPRAVSIDLPSQQVVYNGSKVLFSDYKICEEEGGDLVSGHKIYGSSEAGLMQVGDSIPEDLTPLIYDASGNDVTTNYNISFTMGDIRVVPRPISVKPRSYSKVYDGVELACNDIEFVDGSLVEGQFIEYGINYGYENTLTDVGRITTEVTEPKIYEYQGEEKVDVTENYYIDTFETGVLEITPRPLTITAKSKSWVYDGNEHSLAADRDPLSCEGLAATDTLLYVNYFATLTGVGKTVNGINGYSLSCSPSNYDVTIVDGYIEVTPFEVTVKTASAEKYYDGQPLTAEDISAVLANSKHSIAINDGAAFPSITDAGSKANSYACRIKDLAGADVTNNYTIIYKYGTLTVSPMPVTVKLGEQKVKYDGEEHVPDWTNTNFFDLTAVDDEATQALALTHEDFTMVAYTKSMKNVGSYSYSVRFTDKEMNKNYELEVPKYGYLTIEPLKVTVTTGMQTEGTDGEYVYTDYEIPYDGNPHSGGNPIVTSGQIVTGQSLEAATEKPTITHHGANGYVENKYLCKVTDDETGEDVSSNYLITYDYKNISIKKRNISVNFQNSITISYSNKAYAPDPQALIALITDDRGGALEAGLLEKSDFVAAVDANKEILNVGTYTYKMYIADPLLATDFAIDGADNGKLTGQIVVAPLSVTVSIKNVARDYNGSTFNLTAYDVVHSISDTTTGLTRDDIRVSAEVTAEADVFPYYVSIAEGKAANYTLTLTNVDTGLSGEPLTGEETTEEEREGKVCGTVTIGRFKLTIATKSAVFTYDGTAHSHEYFSAPALPNSNHKIVVDEAGERTSVTDVDVYENKFEVKIYKTDDAGNIIPTEEVTDNYDISYDYGTITVQKCKVKITLPSAEKEYDGELFTCAGSDQIRHTELPVESHVVSIDETRSDETPWLLNVGSRENFFYCKITDGTTDVTANYDIEYVSGTLRITQRTIVVTTATDSAVYNGAAHNVYNIADAGLEFTENGKLLTGLHHLGISTDGDALPTITNVGSIQNKFEVNVLDEGNLDVTSNYNISYVYGTLSITELQVDVTLMEYSTHYTGVELMLPASYVIVGITNVNVDAADPATSLGMPTAAAFRVVVDGTPKDVGTYSYTVCFTDSEYAKNFNLTLFNVGGGSITKENIIITPLDISIDLVNFIEAEAGAITFTNQAVVLNPETAIAAINVGADLLEPSILDKGDFSIVYNEEIRYVRAENYRYSVKITDGNLAKNFNFAPVEGLVEVAKCPVTITLKEFEFTYSGLEYTINPMNAVTTDSFLISGAEFKIETDAVLKDATPVDAPYTYTAVLVNKNFEVVNTDAVGVVRINPLEVNATLRHFYVTYNGSEQRINAAEAVATNSTLLTSSMFNVTLNGGNPVINADDYKYQVELDNTNFTVTCDGAPGTSWEGDFTVNQLPVLVTLKDYTFTYDGTAHNVTAADAVSTNTSLLSGADFTLTLPADVTNAAENTYTANLLPAHVENFDLTFTNYDSKGKIKIEKQTVTVALNNVVTTYDGTEKTLTSEEAVQNVSTTLLTKNNFSVVFSGAAPKKVGLYNYSVELDEDKKVNFNVIRVNGTLEIKKRNVTLTTGSYSEPFDNGEHSNDTVTGVGLVAGHVAQIADAGTLPKIKEVGTKDNVFACKIMFGAEDVTENYNVTMVYGKLTVTKLAVTVTTADAEKIFDGAELKAHTATASNGYTVTPVGNAPTITDAGTLENKFAVQLSVGGVDVTSNCEINYTYGVLKVKPVEVAVTLKSYTGADAMTYNGGIITINAEDAISGTLPTGVTKANFNISYNQAIHDAGAYTYSVAFKSATMANNCVLSVDVGYIYVKPAALSVTLKDYNAVYDGKAQQPKTADITVVGAVGGETITGSDFTLVVPEMRNVGDYTYAATVNNPGVAKNYAITYAGGNYSITKLAVSVTLNSFSFVYSNKPASLDVSTAIDAINTDLLSKTSFTLTGAGVTEKNVRAEAYPYSAEITDREYAKNFELTVQGGEVQITKRRLEFTLADCVISKKQYDLLAGYIPAEGLISVSSGTPLADGDTLTITTASVFGDSDYGEAYLDELVFSLTNSENYEIVDYSSLTARLIIVDQPTTTP